MTNLSSPIIIAQSESYYINIQIKTSVLPLAWEEERWILFSPSSGDWTQLTHTDQKLHSQKQLTTTSQNL